MAVAIVLAAGAAFLSALAVVLQRVALESAPVGSSFSPRLMTHALRKRGWLTGFGLMLCMFVLQASALRYGQLSVVQPVLTCELIFLVIILVTAFHRSVGWRELTGIAAIVAGLAGFFAAASPAARAYWRSSRRAAPAPAGGGPLRSAPPQPSCSRATAP